MYVRLVARAARARTPSRHPESGVNGLQPLLDSVPGCCRRGCRLPSSLTLCVLGSAPELTQGNYRVVLSNAATGFRHRQSKRRANTRPRSPTKEQKNTHPTLARSTPCILDGAPSSRPADTSGSSTKSFCTLNTDCRPHRLL